MRRPGPNDLLPCGTESARKRHWAHGVLCFVCEPDACRMARCPVCRLDVPATVVILSHEVPSRWLEKRAEECAGTGARVFGGRDAA